jgi:hypothetical protein
MYPTVIKLSTVSKHWRLAQLINYSDFKFVAKNYFKIKIFYVSSYFRTVVGDSLAAFGDLRPCPLHGCFPREKKEYFYHGRTPVSGKTRAGPADGQGRGQVPRPTGFSRIPNAATLAAGTRGALCSPLSACAPGTPAPTHARPCPAPSSSPPGLPSKPTTAAPTPPTPPHPRPYRAVPETQRPDPFLHLLPIAIASPRLRRSAVGQVREITSSRRGGRGSPLARGTWMRRAAVEEDAEGVQGLHQGSRS